MGIAKLVKWGNSVGIRIPLQDLKISKAHVGDTFKIISHENGSFSLEPIKKPQEGWLEAFNTIADQKQDALLMDNFENSFDKDEWTW